MADKIMQMTTARPSPIQPIKITPETQAALDAIKRLKERGAAISEKAVVAEAGVSQTPARRALHIAQTTAAVEPAFGREDLSPTAQKKFDIALRRAIDQARIDIHEEIRAEFRKLYEETILVNIQHKLDAAERIRNAHHGVLSRAEYRKVLACLHPDASVSGERRAEAFRLFSEQEVVLVKPEQLSPRPGVAPLPKTYEEMLARKAEYDAKRRAERGARKAKSPMRRA